MTDRFFYDCMDDPNINWGTFPIQIKHQIRDSEWGVIKVIDTVIEDFEALSSPQLLKQDQVEKQGFGDWIAGEVYVVYTLENIPMNKDNSDYRTILFNNKEYEIIRSSFFGVNEGTDLQDGYYIVNFARKIDNLGV